MAFLLQSISKIILSLLFILAYFGCAHAQMVSKPRIIITADPELDDNNSLIRFILYSTDVQIEGLIYASSQFHWKGDGKGTKWFVPGREYDRFNMNTCPCESWRWNKDEQFIHDIVAAYAMSYPNLKIHNADYPNPDYLKSIIRYGNIEFDGDFSKDTPGSELIKSAMLDDKAGPLYITSWGGASTIARALKSIEDQYLYSKEWAAIKSKIVRKVILLPSGDQDDTYVNYIKPHWPEIETRHFKDSPNYGYGAQINAKPENAPLLTPTFMTENITSKGPLGQLYRVWGDGKQMVKGDKVDYFGMAGYTNDELKKMGYFVWMPVQEKGSWLGEGDNATFMNMIGNGLRAYEHGFYGGWGGRTSSMVDHSNMFATETTADQMAAQMSAMNDQNNGVTLPYPDFFAQAQNSFAARMKWTVSPQFKDANHEPKISINGPLKVMANAGQKIKLYASTSDADGHQVSVSWIQMPSGTYQHKVAIDNPHSKNAEIIVPLEASAGQTIHIIAQATDDGRPALTSYQRVVIEVREK